MKQIINRLRKYWKIGIVSLLAIAIPSAYAAQKTTLPIIGKQTEYQTITPSIQDIEELVSISGVLDADKKATLKFQSGGLLTWVGVKEGDYVKKYQAIASLDKRSLKKSLKKKMNAYLTQRWDFEQTQDDYKETKDNYLVTDSIKRILEKAQFNLEDSVIDYELQNLTLRLATIMTPIEGIVTSVRSPQPGVNVTPLTSTFEIVNPSTIYFSAELDETDLAKVKNNASANIVLDAYPEEWIPSSVRSISFTPKKSSSGTVYEVKLALPLDNSSLKYKIGLNGDAQIIVQKKQNALTVPSETVKLKDSKTVINVLRNGKKQTLEVKTGIETEDVIEILSGLNPDDQVIVSSSTDKK